MEKKKYAEPETEITEFGAQDVIVTSTTETPETNPNEGPYYG